METQQLWVLQTLLTCSNCVPWLHVTWGDAYHAEVNRTGPSCCYKWIFYKKWIGRAGEMMPSVTLLAMPKKGPELQPP